MPNPFYQIYEGAALLAAPNPSISVHRGSDWLADLGCRRRHLGSLRFFTCARQATPVVQRSTPRLDARLELADRTTSSSQRTMLLGDLSAGGPSARGFARGVQPPAAMTMRAASSAQPLKRSNLPGLRSGFIAGDARLVERFGAFHTYHGCGMPVHVQHASILAWSMKRTWPQTVPSTEQSSMPCCLCSRGARRASARGGFSSGRPPDAWSGDDEAFARDLYAATNVLTLPGAIFHGPAPPATPAWDAYASHWSRRWKTASKLRSACAPL